MTQVTEQQVLRALETVTDFERGADVVSLGMISGLRIEDGEVHFAIEVDGEQGASKKPLRSACERAVGALPGVTSVAAVLTAHRDSNGGAESGDGVRTETPADDPVDDEDDEDDEDGLRAQVIEALQTVYDPEIPVNLYELGLIYRVDVDDDRNVYIEMTLTTPGCPVAGSMPGEVEDAVRMGVPDVGDVRVNLVWDPPWTMDRMSEAARLELGFF